MLLIDPHLHYHHYILLVPHRFISIHILFFLMKPIVQNIDWHSAPLSMDTTIDTAYKNTQNVRRFFRQHLGDAFHFDRAFMQYLKTNMGISLQQAIEYRLQQLP